jgi:aldehyde dehydrogenase (NAD+)
VQTQLFVGGEFAAAASGRCLPVENPATEEILCEVAEGDARDVDRAVGAARTCFESDGWQKLEPRQRGRMLARAADLLEARAEEFARLETQQNGKPLFESRIDVAMTVETLRYYAGWADKVTGATLPLSAASFVYTLKEPVGVVGAIVPWNFPLNIASW